MLAVPWQHSAQTAHSQLPQHVIITGAHQYECNSIQRGGKVLL